MAAESRSLIPYVPANARFLATLQFSRGGDGDEKLTDLYPLYEGTNIVGRPGPNLHLPSTRKLDIHCKYLESNHFCIHTWIPPPPSDSMDDDEDRDPLNPLGIKMFFLDSRPKDASTRHHLVIRRDNVDFQTNIRSPYILLPGDQISVGNSIWFQVIFHRAPILDNEGQVIATDIDGLDKMPFMQALSKNGPSDETDERKALAANMIRYFRLIDRNKEFQAPTVHLIPFNEDGGEEGEGEGVKSQSGQNAQNSAQNAQNSQTAQNQMYPEILSQLAALQAALDKASERIEGLDQGLERVSGEAGEEKEGAKELSGRLSVLETQLDGFKPEDLEAKVKDNVVWVEREMETVKKVEREMVQLRKLVHQVEDLVHEKDEKTQKDDKNQAKNQAKSDEIEDLEGQIGELKQQVDATHTQFNQVQTDLVKIYKTLGEVCAKQEEQSAQNEQNSSKNSTKNAKNAKNSSKNSMGDDSSESDSDCDSSSPRSSSIASLSKRLDDLVALNGKLEQVSNGQGKTAQSMAGLIQRIIKIDSQLADLNAKTQRMEELEERMGRMEEMMKGQHGQLEQSAQNSQNFQNSQNLQNSQNFRNFQNSQNASSSSNGSKKDLLERQKSKREMLGVAVEDDPFAGPSQIDGEEEEEENDSSVVQFQNSQKSQQNAKNSQKLSQFSQIEETTVPPQPTRTRSRVAPKVPARSFQDAATLQVEEGSGDFEEDGGSSEEELNSILVENQRGKHSQDVISKANELSLEGQIVALKEAGAGQKQALEGQKQGLGDNEQGVEDKKQGNKAGKKRKNNEMGDGQDSGDEMVALEAVPVQVQPVDKKGQKGIKKDKSVKSEEVQNSQNNVQNSQKLPGFDLAPNSKRRQAPRGSSEEEAVQDSLASDNEDSSKREQSAKKGKNAQNAQNAQNTQNAQNAQKNLTRNQSSQNSFLAQIDLKTDLLPTSTSKVRLPTFLSAREDVLLGNVDEMQGLGGDDQNSKNSPKSSKNDQKSSKNSKNSKTKPVSRLVSKALVDTMFDEQSESDLDGWVFETTDGESDVGDNDDDDEDNDESPKNSQKSSKSSQKTTKNSQKTAKSSQKTAPKSSKQRPLATSRSLFNQMGPVRDPAPEVVATDTVHPIILFTGKVTKLSAADFGPLTGSCFVLETPPPFPQPLLLPRALPDLSGGLGSLDPAAILKRNEHFIISHGGTPIFPTHVICSDLSRTAKSMEAFSNVAHIVTEEWVRGSIKAGEWLSEEDYYVEDETNQEKFDFQLDKSLSLNRFHRSPINIYNSLIKINAPLVAQYRRDARAMYEAYSEGIVTTTAQNSKKKSKSAPISLTIDPEHPYSQSISKLQAAYLSMLVPIESKDRGEGFLGKSIVIFADSLAPSELPQIIESAGGIALPISMKAETDLQTILQSEKNGSTGTFEHFLQTPFAWQSENSFDLLENTLLEPFSVPSGKNPKYACQNSPSAALARLAQYLLMFHFNAFRMFNQIQAKGGSGSGSGSGKTGTKSTKTKGKSEKKDNSALFCANFKPTALVRSKWNSIVGSQLVGHAVQLHEDILIEKIQENEEKSAQNAQNSDQLDSFLHSLTSSLIDPHPIFALSQSDPKSYSKLAKIIRSMPSHLHGVLEGKNQKAVQNGQNDQKMTQNGQNCHNKQISSLPDLYLLTLAKELRFANIFQRYSAVAQRAEAYFSGSEDQTSNKNSSKNSAKSAKNAKNSQDSQDSDDFDLDYHIEHLQQSVRDNVMLDEEGGEEGEMSSQQKGQNSQQNSQNTQNSQKNHIFPPCIPSLDDFELYLNLYEQLTEEKSIFEPLLSLNGHNLGQNGQNDDDFTSFRIFFLLDDASLQSNDQLLKWVKQCGIKPITVNGLLTSILRQENVADKQPYLLTLKK